MVSEELLMDVGKLVGQRVEEKKMYVVLQKVGYAKKDIKLAIDTVKERNVSMKQIIEEASEEEDYNREVAKSDSFFRRTIKKIFG
jgi:hypothetical protein